MRTWMKATLAGVALIVVGVIALAGTGAYFVFRHLETKQSAESEAVQAINTVKTRFGARAPLIEIADVRSGDIRINRPDEASPSRVSTVHIINWKSEDGELVRTEVPLWLMRFSSVNILSHLGVTPAKFRLTVGDIERYGPGIVVDYAAQGAFRVLVWVD